jgi:hypothetical protein
MDVTKQQLIQISDAWGELAFSALELLERTAPDAERAGERCVPIAAKVKAARQRATMDLSAALFAVPALKKAIGRFEPVIGSGQ